MLNFVKTNTQNGNYLYKGKKIPIARVDMSTKNPFLDHEKLVFNELPITMIVFDQKFY